MSLRVLQRTKLTVGSTPVLVGAKDMNCRSEASLPWRPHPEDL